MVLWSGQDFLIGRPRTFAQPLIQFSGSEVVRRLSPVSSVTDLCTYYFARNNDFDSAILLAAGSRAIVCDRHRFAEPTGAYAVGGQPLCDQVVLDGTCPLLRELLIQLVTAGAVGM